MWNVQSKSVKAGRLLGVSLLGFSLALTLGLVSGCNNAEVEQLKQENATLKAELDLLKQAQSQTVTADPAASTPSPTTGQYPNPSPQAFKDVTAEVPGAEMINDLALLKVFEGMGDTFKPYEPITRGEYVTWLFKAYNAEHPANQQIRMSPSFKVPFTDLKPTDPSYPYVQAMANAGFSVGYDNKTFKPNQPITREEMIHIKYGTDGDEQYAAVSGQFADWDKVDKRYTHDIYADSSLFGDDGPKGGNIMRAFGPIKSFKPKETVLRSEAAATLWATDHRSRISADQVLGRSSQ